MNIFIAGDSTAAQKLPEKKPETGWGECLKNFFNSEVNIINYAKNGQSTKSFIESELFTKVENEIKPGDYFLIQFGHNDQKIEKPRGTLPFGEYQKNIKKLVDLAVTHNATPIILSPVTRRAFINGTIDSQIMGDYPKAAKELAKQEKVIFLDLHLETQKLFNNLGDPLSRRFFLQLAPGENINYPNGVEDNTHFNEYGAFKIAELITKALRQTSSPLKNYLKE